MNDITNLLGKIHNVDCLPFMRSLPKGSKASIRVYAAKNGYKGVSECIRAGIDMLMCRKCNLEAVAGQIEGIGEDKVNL